MVGDVELVVPGARFPLLLRERETEGVIEGVVVDVPVESMRETVDVASALIEREDEEEAEGEAGVALSRWVGVFNPLFLDEGLIVNEPLPAEEEPLPESEDDPPR